MKAAASILKALQTGGIFGSVAVILTAGRWNGRNPELISFDALAIGFIVTAIASSLCLAFMGERKRAWQGAVLMIVLIVLAGFLSAPMVIR
jgi:hypothetical protein